MRRLAVFIGTTGGPVAVERITHEPAARASMVCQGRSARQLALSDGYDSFVAPGIGAVARAFGPFPEGGFRMDLSAPVSGGDSWQLAAFVAHAVLADPDSELAGSVDTADAVVWLSGAVDYDFAVGAVDHMAEKLHASADAMAAWRDGGRPVVLLLPAGSSSAAADAGLHDAIACHEVASAVEACRHLELAVPAAAGEARSGRAIAAPSGGKLRLGLILAVLVTGAVAAVAWQLVRDGATRDRWQARLATVWPATGPPQKASAAAPIAVAATGSQTTPAVTAPAIGSAATEPGRRSPLDLKLTWHRAPQGETCVRVLFGTVPPVFTASRGPRDGLCGFDAEIAVDPPQAHVAADLVLQRGHLILPEAPRRAVGSADNPWRWSFELPGRPRTPAAFQILAVAGEQPVEAALQRLRSADDTVAVARELRQSGLAVLVHRVDLGP